MRLKDNMSKSEFKNFEKAEKFERAGNLVQAKDFFKAERFK